MRFLTISMVVALCSTVIAQGGGTAMSPPKGRWYGSLDWLTEKRNSWAGGVERMASGLDGFLAGKEAEQQATNSFVRVRIGAVFSEGEGWIEHSDIKLKLDLPATKKRWQLFLENQLNERETLSTINQSAIEEESSSFFGGAAKELRSSGWKLRREIGVRFRLPLEPFARYKAEKQFALGKVWSSRLRQSLYYFHQDGFGAKSQLFFERPWGDDYFRAKTALRWSDQDDRWEWAQVFTRQHQLSERSASSLNIGVLGDSEPHARVESYFLNLFYRKSLHEDWLFGELVPEVAWERERNFRQRWSITARVEMLLAE